MPRITAALILSFAALSFLPAGPAVAGPSPARVSTALAARVARRPARVIVRLTPAAPAGVTGPAAVATTMAAQDRLAADVGLTPLRRGVDGSWLATTVDAAALQTLAARPDVEEVVEERPARAQLGGSTVLMGAPVIWNHGVDGAGWTVAVLDTGVDASHPMLAGKVVAEACFSTTAPALKSTSLCPGGAAFAEGPGAGAACADVGECWHGTHVAGIAAGRAATISGVAPGASLLAIQVFSRSDDDADDMCGSYAPCLLSWPSDQIAALEYVRAWAGAHNARRVAAVNLSLAGPAQYQVCDGLGYMASYKAAVDALRALGVATVAAAGNMNDPVAIAEPACLSTVVSVGSSTDTDTMATGWAGSNRAPFLSMLAPGDGIVSGVPGGTYYAASGTSMATAHVSGAFALIKQAVPDARVADVVAAVRATATAIGDPFNGRVYPRIAIDRAAVRVYVDYATTPRSTPGAPAAPAASVAGSQVTVGWTAPQTGAAATGYTLLVGGAPGTTDLAVLDVGPATGVAGRLPAGTYYLRVRARNAAGDGPPSPETSFTIGGLGAPGPVSVQVAGGTVTLSWHPPDGATPDGYVVEAGLGPAAADVMAVTALPCASPGLVVPSVASGTYWVRVRAVDDGTAGSATAPVTVVVP